MGVKGTVEIEVSTGEYSIESGHLLFVEKEIYVELLGINKETEEIEVCPLNDNIDISEYDYTIDDFIPYLRPMSSMTEEEKRKYASFIGGQKPFDSDFSAYPKEYRFVYEWDVANYVNWLNSHHFDYHGLIPKGLAIEAPDGMYNK